MLGTSHCKHSISGQSTQMVKGCMEISLLYAFTIVKGTDRLFLQESSKVKESSLYVIRNVDTVFLLCTVELPS